MARINVVMPVYNAAPFLREAIESILAQTLTDFRLLILDDGSTDESFEIAQSYANTDSRVILDRGTPHVMHSPSYPANQLLSLVEPEAVFVARMDADDIADPRRLEREAKFLDEHDSVSLVASRGWLIDPTGRIIGLAGGMGRRQKAVLDSEQVSSLLISQYNPVLQNTVMWRRGVLETVGGYDLRLIYAEDMDLWQRCARAGYRWAILPEPLVYYRIHPTSLSRSRLDLELVAHQRVVRQEPLDHPYPTTITEAMRELDPPMRWRFIISSLVRSGDSVRATEAMSACLSPRTGRVVRWVGQRRLVRWGTRWGIAGAWSWIHRTYWGAIYHRMIRQWV